MTKNYFKPELEVISVYSEGVLATSGLFDNVVSGESRGEDITLGGEFSPWKR